MFDILVADDFPLFRHAVKDLLRQGLIIRNIGEAGTVGEMLNQVKAHDWDAVVMDIGMPGGSGPEALTELKRMHPRLPVLVLTMYPENQYAMRMFKAGANGYLRKTAIPTELVMAVKKILRGETYVNPEVGETLARETCTYAQKLPHEILSNREYQILTMLASGKRFGQIAEALSLSPTTISTYRARILKKMNAQTNHDLIRYAIQHGIVQ